MTSAAEQSVQHRAWITAKGLRALGRPVPDDIADDEVVILLEVEVPAP